ncbi:MAG: CubicO group peptidase (beta-lactamase class C family) [Rhodothermales bacterium]|jgi:CubicO group peptidase (beta-lactamase class C family)
MERREFLKSSALATGGLWVGSTATGTGSADIDDFLTERMATLHIPGLAACAMRGGDIVWSGGYGFADLERRIPMGLDTIQNIASISKSVTSTALMQLWEQGAFQLDGDVNDHLPFSVRNPLYPQTPITFAQLLTHTSSISDGTSYSRSYACGDPAIDLTSWMEEYFIPGGRSFDATENYHVWAPGGRFAYNNVAFGLLAFIVERISGVPFDEYCRNRIFQPLGMNETAWYLSEIDTSRHAVPYTWVEDGVARGPTWGGEAQGAIGVDGPSGTRIEGQGYTSNCLYNHPNYPDGFLRTSVRQLASFGACYLRGGSPILEPKTIKTMLSLRSDNIRGLGWDTRRVESGVLWGHGGADPGVNTRIDLDPEQGIGAIVFANTFLDDGASGMKLLNERILLEAQG